MNAQARLRLRCSQIRKQNTTISHLKNFIIKFLLFIHLRLEQCCNIECLVGGVFSYRRIDSYYSHTVHVTKKPYSIRVKSGKFGPQVNSDTHLQTV